MATQNIVFLVIFIIFLAFLFISSFVAKNWVKETDDYVLAGRHSRDNDQSYYYFMHQNLFDHVNIPAENTHLPNGMEPDSQKECQEYTNLIQSLGGVDLQLLGIGHNGLSLHYAKG